MKISKKMTIATTADADSLLNRLGSVEPPAGTGAHPLEF